MTKISPNCPQKAASSPPVGPVDVVGTAVVLVLDDDDVGDADVPGATVVPVRPVLSLAARVPAGLVLAVGTEGTAASAWSSTWNNRTRRRQRRIAGRYGQGPGSAGSVGGQSSNRLRWDPFVDGTAPTLRLVPVSEADDGNCSPTVGVSGAPGGISGAELSALFSGVPGCPQCCVRAGPCGVFP
ncbi:MAG: hypothetical protein N2037_07715 [Acidimicrobiales bacterium]|nr:hypothetical protein [Acidimicrobiales bacterium]